MPLVEIVTVQNSLVLRARGSELLILPHHAKELKTLEKPKEFSGYFRQQALINRPARKLFEAWLRKDNDLWPRIYNMVHKEMEFSEEDADESDSSNLVKTNEQNKPAHSKKSSSEEQPKSKVDTESDQSATKDGGSKKLSKKASSAKPVSTQPDVDKPPKKATAKEKSTAKSTSEKTSTKVSAKKETAKKSATKKSTAKKKATTQVATKKTTGKATDTKKSTGNKSVKKTEKKAAGKKKAGKS